MNLNLYLCSVAICLMMMTGLCSVAQTNPSPFDLSTGNYSMTFWDSLAPAGTYPANMVFHFINNSTQSGFDSSAVGNSDWDCVYNRHSRNRMLGLDSTGFSFNATSSGQYSDCNSVVGSDSALRFVGAAVLGLNTLSRTNVQVSWLGGTIVPGAGTPVPRLFTVRLQYRIGTSGNFQDVPGPVEYLSSLTAGDTQRVGPATLPLSCENQSNIQVRWLYFQQGANNGGTRPQMSVDEINVASSISTSIIENHLEELSVHIYPNPSATSLFIEYDRSGKKEVRMYNSLGRKVAEVFSPENKIVIRRGDLSDGLYFVEVSDEGGNVLSRSKIIFN